MTIAILFLFLSILKHQKPSKVFRSLVKMFKENPCSQLSVAILTQDISKTKNVCMKYFFNIFSKSQDIRGWRFKTTNQKSA